MSLMGVAAIVFMLRRYYASNSATVADFRAEPSTGVR